MLYNKAVSDALLLAIEYARAQCSPEVGWQHLLREILRPEGSCLRRMFTVLDIDYRKVRLEIEKRQPADTDRAKRGDTPSQIVLSGDLRAVLDDAFTISGGAPVSTADVCVGLVQVLHHKHDPVSALFKIDPDHNVAFEKVRRAHADAGVDGEPKSEIEQLRDKMNMYLRLAEAAEHGRATGDARPPEGTREERVARYAAMVQSYAAAIVAREAIMAGQSAREFLTDE